MKKFLRMILIFALMSALVFAVSALATDSKGLAVQISQHAKAVRNGIRQAGEIIRQRVNETISEKVRELEL